MKNILLGIFTGILLFPSTLLHGQNSKLGLTIEGGPAYATMYKSDYPQKDFSPILGGYAGLLFNYQFSKYFALETGLAYERKGAEFKTSFDSYGSGSNVADFIFHFDYLTVPALIKAKFGGKFCFLIEAGPYISILLKQTYIDNTNKNGDHDGLMVDPVTYSDKKNYDLGFSGSLGLELAIAEKASVSLKLTDHVGFINTGLFPVIKGSDGTTYSTSRSSYLNSAIISLGFSYFFGNEKK